MAAFSHTSPWRRAGFVPLPTKVANTFFLAISYVFIKAVNVYIYSLSFCSVYWVKGCTLYLYRCRRNTFTKVKVSDENSTQVKVFSFKGTLYVEGKSTQICF